MKTLDKKKPNCIKCGLINNQPTNTGLKPKGDTKIKMTSKYPTETCGGAFPAPYLEELKPKELEWDRTVEVKSMNIVFQICDLLGTDVGIRQTHNDTMIDFTKGIINDLLTQQRTELLGEKKNSCHCKYDSDGKRIGLCLRCVKLRLEAFNKGRRELLEEIKGLFPTNITYTREMKNLVNKILRGINKL